ncbi:MAG: ABC transporter ATP-binding protein [Phycisphaerales bacterium]
MTQATTTTDARTGGVLPSDRAIVAAQRLTKTFRDFWMRSRVRAVDGITLDVNQREIFGLLGPNGSGKSTTIKLILGLLRPTSGRLVVFNKRPTDVATKKRIGYLPEESHLYPFLNARETLDYYAKLFELDHRTRTRRIDELLDMVGLTHAQFRPVREYSKGMARRIGIAQALINDPDLLILDEPTTGLDPIGTRQVKDLILELGRRGKTVILSSHLLSDVEDVVDRMVILYGGKIRGEGTCDELLQKHNRTTIETDQLDEQTLAEIDALIRKRTGGDKSVLRVSHPRQKLEELFLGIVEKARAERLETAGAQDGGPTAAFLRAEPEGGQALIDRLVEGADETSPEGLAPARVEGEDEPTTPKGADESLIRSLVEPEEPEAPTPTKERASPRTPAKPSANVDQDVISSLLDTSDDDEPDAKT